MRSAKLLTAALLMLATIASAQKAYLGFDKNDYPGDDLLPGLHKTFAWTGYWLNNPPGMTSNPWAGKRGKVRAAGFGFMILFNGRLDAPLKGQDAAALGREDAAAAIAAVQREGFAPGAILFLDQEEGGGLLAEQAAYLGAWITAIHGSTYKAGVYCSGIPVPFGAQKISTAQDVAQRFPTAKLWVWNDQCPPSPGCMIPITSLDPAKSGLAETLVWQYAQSPRRPDDTAACVRTYAGNGCYAPGLAHSGQTLIDLNVSRSPDPSHGR